ncbi:MAG: hypothetical protein AAF393_07500 [Pseudomonadota bacterium]
MRQMVLGTILAAMPLFALAQTENEVTATESPTVPAAEEVTPEPPAPQEEARVSQEELVQLQKDMKALKSQFLDLNFIVQGIEERRVDMEAEFFRFRDKVAPLVGGFGNDLTTEIEALRAELTAHTAESGHAGGIIEDVIARLSMIEQRLSAVEGGGFTPNPDPGPITDPNPNPDPFRQDPEPTPGQEGFSALTGDGGQLTSLYKRQLSDEDVARLVSEADCEAAGSWFQDAFRSRDYNAFFINSGGSIRVCERVSLGWRSLRAGNSKRAHVLFSGE